MTIKDQKDLAKLIALCRKSGVQSIKVDNIEFHLGEEPRVGIAKPKMSNPHTGSSFDTIMDPGPIQPMDRITDEDDLTDDQRLFYSSDAAPDAFGAEQD